MRNLDSNTTITATLFGNGARLTLTTPTGERVCIDLDREKLASLQFALYDLLPTGLVEAEKRRSESFSAVTRLSTELAATTSGG